MAKKKILILFAHPAFQKSRANLGLTKAVSDLDEVTFRDLYELYPDFNIDVGEEQRLLLENDVVVFHHPFYWYSCPALLKEWQDLVLEHGFAYGQEGTALNGKWMLSAITMGGTQETYCHQGSNHYTIPELLQPFEQTARLCGMIYLPPFVMHGVNNLLDEDIEKACASYRGVIESLRDGRLSPENVGDMHYINDADFGGGSHA